MTAGKKAVSHDVAESELNVLVNNAGICKLTANQNAVTPSLDVSRDVFNTNFFGTIQTTAMFIPLLRKSTGPSPVILNVTSGLGSNTLRAKSTFNDCHLTEYNASKLGMYLYTAVT
ncbi:hypothetical protein BJ912DRAFT_1070224 [Pholiota molesta]|nr:hypothetical protein BJ912DRAFT_1070224 [Pholiota molesta]